MITAKAKVRDVQNYVKLTEEEICRVLEDNQEKLNLTEKQKERWHKNVCALLNLRMLRKLPLCPLITREIWTTGSLSTRLKMLS